MHSEGLFYRSKLAAAMTVCLLAWQPASLSAGTTGDCSVGDAPLPFVGFACDQGLTNTICQQVGSAWVCDLAANGVGSPDGENFLTDAVLVTHFSHHGPTFSAWGVAGVGSFCCTFEIGTAELIDRAALIGTDENDQLSFQDAGNRLYNPPANLAPLLIGEMSGRAGLDAGLGSFDASASYRDELHGEDGDDFLEGSFGVDRLYGGPGADELNGDADRDQIYGGGGDDTLRGGGGNDLLVGGPDNDTLVGGSGSDEMQGADGDDLILGGNGLDELVGGNGADTLCDGSGGDLYLGGAGGDLLWNDPAGGAPAPGSSGGTSSLFFPDECGHVKWIFHWVPRTCTSVLTSPPADCL